MGGGTFFKVMVHVKKTIEKFCALNWQLWRHKHWNMTSLPIHHILWRSKLHYLRQNYTTMKIYRWNTWNSNRLLQGRLRSTASLGPTICFHGHSSGSSHDLYWLDKGRKQLFISGGGQFSWTFIRWRHRAYSTVIQLLRKRSQIKFFS